MTQMSRFASDPPKNTLKLFDEFFYYIPLFYFIYLLIMNVIICNINEGSEMDDLLTGWLTMKKD